MSSIVQKVELSSSRGAHLQCPTNYHKRFQMLNYGCWTMLNWTVFTLNQFALGAMLLSWRPHCTRLVQLQANLKWWLACCKDFHQSQSWWSRVYHPNIGCQSTRGCRGRADCLSDTGTSHRLHVRLIPARVLLEFAGSLTVVTYAIGIQFGIAKPRLSVALSLAAQYLGQVKDMRHSIFQSRSEYPHAKSKKARHHIWCWPFQTWQVKHGETIHIGRGAYRTARLRRLALSPLAGHSPSGTWL